MKLFIVLTCVIAAPGHHRGYGGGGGYGGYGGGGGFYGQQPGFGVQQYGGGQPGFGGGFGGSNANALANSQSGAFGNPGRFGQGFGSPAYGGGGYGGNGGFGGPEFGGGIGVLNLLLLQIHKASASSSPQGFGKK